MNVTHKLYNSFPRVLLFASVYIFIVKIVGALPQLLPAARESCAVCVKPN
jgi:hypothetical protein